MTGTRADPETFAEEALDGFAAVHRVRVQRVEGGVVRRGGTPAGSVAVVIGDVLHFGQAEQRLLAAGVGVRSVLVTDDIASAPEHERSRRRGVAGDLVVFKIAGAAAADGQSLDEVERLARLANDRTRSLAVAFGGCTLPGQQAPLFTVPAGRMAVGLGIHGEPGTGEQDVSTPEELAELLVSRLLTEAPAKAGARVAVLLNGLGTVKHEELLVICSAVQRLLDDRGLTAVEPECGELVTSLDMAGVSLTLCWLTDELETLWRAPADAPAFRRTELPEPSVDREFRPTSAAAAYREPEGSTALAGVLLTALGAAAARLEHVGGAR